MCDFNRGPQTAYESPLMEPHYNMYHDTVKRYITMAKALCGDDWQGRCILLDMHGQSELRDHIIRGTRDTRTVQPMLLKHGVDALIGPNSIFGYLNDNGTSVFPITVPLSVSPNQATPASPAYKVPLDPFKEHPEFNGAFTVAHYSLPAYGIDTIQVEIGFTHRATPESCIRFTRVFRDAILAYYRSYIKQ
eukprot:gene13282-15612_t